MFMFLGLTGGCSGVMHGANDPDGDNDTKGINYFPPTRPATGNRVFMFSPRRGAWAAYDEQGKRVNTGKASGGASYCSDIGRSCRTVVGTFRVYAKGDSGCISGRYPVETHGGAPMPYCMHFHPKGYAIHGSYNIPNYNASHGCIRVTPPVARWLNQNFMQTGSTVMVLPY
jgi:hypothetical protein